MVRPVNIAAAVIRAFFHVVGFRYDDDTVDRAVDNIDAVIHNFFYVHPRPVNHLLDDVYDDAADARGVSRHP